MLPPPGEKKLFILLEGGQVAWSVAVVAQVPARKAENRLLILEEVQKNL